MIAWILKKTARTPVASPTNNTASRAAPSCNCALWHDVERALDAKPKGATK